jgi:hypothetical protein
MIEIPLSSRKYRGLVALVDEAKAELVAGYNWSPSKSRKTFYAVTRIAARRPTCTARARDAAALEFFGEGCYLNFPDERKAV